MVPPPLAQTLRLPPGPVAVCGPTVVPAMLVPDPSVTAPSTVFVFPAGLAGGAVSVSVMLDVTVTEDDSPHDAPAHDDAAMAGPPVASSGQASARQATPEPSASLMIFKVCPSQ